MRALETTGPAPRNHRLKRVRLNGTNENDYIFENQEGQFIAYLTDTEMYIGEFYRTTLGWRFRGKKLTKGAEERVEMMLNVIRSLYLVILL